MKRLFNWILVLGACVGAFYLIGLIVPRSQTLGSKTNLQAEPHQLHKIVSDVGSWSQWHPDVSSASERPQRNGKQVWLVTGRNNEIFELEVTNDEAPETWQCTYTLNDTRVTLRFDFGWYGSGGRARITRSVDTRDPWKRARRFLWSPEEASAVGILNALTERVGEEGAAEEF